MLPFSVFLRGSRPYYYVAFKNLETGKYLPAISTKKTKRPDAEKQAWVWFREGIPRRGGAVDLKSISLRDTIKRAEISAADAEYIIGELMRRGLILSCVFPGAPNAVRFSDYLSSFWDWDSSPYIQEKLRAEHSIHKNYVSQMSSAIKKYWLPYFPSVLLGELSTVDIDSFCNHLSDIRFGDNQVLSNSRKNVIVKAGAVPLRWAYRKGMITQDITKGVVSFSGKSAARQILTPQLAAAIFSQQWNDERAKVANMTAMATGLRAGELQGLRFSDLGEGCLMVRHSWNRKDKLKTTKTNEERTVELPFPSVMAALRRVASLNPHGNSYVFWSSLSDNKPMEQRLFITGLRDALISSGLDEKSAKVYSFHGWRHFFTTYMRNKIEDKLLQTQTGHKSIPMLEHYSAHRLPGDRDKIREAQLEVFSSLLPSS